jgi:HPt (histidine-containing phosphotransfer) domain-containing protein
MGAIAGVLEMMVRLQDRAGRPAGGTAGPVDLAHLDRATFGDAELRREVLAMFDRQAVKLMAEIAAAPDPHTRREAAHTLRGAALGIGANAVAGACAEIEESAGDPDDLKGALARLAIRVAEARLAIGGLLAKDGA